MSLSAEQEAAFRANTTTGDPFDVHSASVAAWRNVWTLLDEERALTNALRDALEKADAAFNAWARDEDGIHPDAWPAVEHLRATLKAHPAASLAAHDAEVGLRVVSECAMTMRSRCSCSHCDENEPGWEGRAIVERALAAQAQEVKS